MRNFNEFHDKNNQENVTFSNETLRLLRNVDVHLHIPAITQISPTKMIFEHAAQH